MDLPNDIASYHRIVRELATVVEGIKPQEGYVQQIEAQSKQIAYLEHRVKELESQSRQNSRNSNYPSSMDKYKTRPAFFRANGGKIGGKKRHDGGTLKMVLEPDVVKKHTPEVCAHCGWVHGKESLRLCARRQVFDIPPPRIEGAEHQAQNELVYICLAEDEPHIKSKLLQSKAVNFDESGFYVGREGFWDHVASKACYTALFVHPKGGAAAHEADRSILPSFQNWAIYDSWPTCFNFTGCRHAVCGAHVLRVLTALVESGGKWAQSFHAFLLALYKRSDHGRMTIPTNEQAEALLKYQNLLEQADNGEPPPIQQPCGKPKKTKGRNVFDRLTRHRDAVLAFVFHQEAPFTNYEAERDIRPIKAKMKVSGCFRTQHGAEIYARIQSFLSTVRKLQFNPFNALLTVLSGGIPEYRLARD